MNTLSYCFFPVFSAFDLYSVFKPKKIHTLVVSTENTEFPFDLRLGFLQSNICLFCHIRIKSSMYLLGCSFLNN